LVQWRSHALRHPGVSSYKEAMHLDRLPRRLLSRLSLASWLSALVLTMVALVLLVGVLLVEHFAQAQAERRAAESLRQVAIDLRDALDRGMAQQFKEVRVLAQLQPFRQLDKPAELRRALEQVQLGFDHFAWLGVTDPRGRVVAAAGGLLQGVDVSQRPWWQGAQGGAFVGDVHAAVLLEKLLPRQEEPWRFVDFAVPLLDARGERLGVLGVHLSWTWARQIKNELINATLASHLADVLVLGRDERVLLGVSAMEGQLLPGVSGQPGLQRLRQQGQEFFAISVPTRGHGAYAGLGWSVVVRQPVAVALADYEQLRQRLLLSALGMMALALPLSWWLGRRLARPLTQLAAAIAARHHLGEGQLPIVGGYLEAGLLSDALAELSQRQAEQDRSQGTLNASLEQCVTERTQELQQTLARLGASEQRLRAVTDNLPAMVAHFDRQLRCVFANDLALRVHGRSLAQAQGLSLRQALGEASYALHEPYVHQAMVGKTCHFDGELQCEEGGRTAHFQSHLVPDLDAQGQVQGFYLMSFDITRLKQAELNAARSEQRLRTIADNLPVLIAYLDAQQRLRFLNGTYRQWLGLNPEQSLGRSLAEVIGPQLYEQRREPLRRALAGERVSFELRSDFQGRQRDLHTDYIPDLREDGTVAGLYALTSDVSAFKTAQRELDQLSRVDVLTGLPNRRQFDERLPEALARARRSVGQGQLALMFLDLDRFKHINDSLGHGVGDQVLCAFAERLRASVRATDLVSRLAGDEFVMVLEGLHDVSEATQVADKVLAKVSEPVVLEGQTLDMSTSIGIACWRAGESPAELLARADRALYAAKAAGRCGWHLDA
jgi:diguanylate cyclase (GGDEF)-like protein/PAS domain S-box-containing protein